jgi:hypothetical protein
MSDAAIKAEVERLMARLAGLREEQHRRLLQPYTDIRLERLRRDEAAA